MKEIQRTYFPGSEWVYLKIYTGSKNADKLLTKELPFIINRIKKESLIEKWFFIRYADPDFHIRLRFLTKEKAGVDRITEVINNRLHTEIRCNLIWKIQLDAYNRELERYGGALIEEAESLFHADSNCVLAILKQLHNNEEHRWMIALKMTDALLSDFSFDLAAKQKLSEQISASFKTEFGFNEHNAKQFNVKYRSHKTIVDSVMKETIDDMNFTELYKQVKKRSKELKPVIARIKSGRNEIALETLLPSYIHMTMNRLFMSRNRVHELVLYDYLRRYYTSEIARTK